MNASHTTVPDTLIQRFGNKAFSYRDYIDCALYAENCGYYQKPRPRVGRSPERDFYTAESLGRVFSKLVVSAAVDLLGKEQAAQSQFIEIAAEPGCSLLNHLKEPSPFAQSGVIRQGDPIKAEGSVVLFANEWLDALPFHRLQYVQGAWRERSVRVLPDGNLEAGYLDQLSPAVEARKGRLPDCAEEGYQLDWPIAAEEALQDLLKQDWNGLILLFDYGKSWAELTEYCPEGTARCYQRHVQSTDLLELPGAKDITCDLCWDPLISQLQAAHCQSVTLESQEGFLVRRAGMAAETIVRESAGDFSTDRQTLMELIHPAHMGQRFQVLWAMRPS